MTVRTSSNSGQSNDIQTFDEFAVQIAVRLSVRWPPHHVLQLCYRHDHCQPFTSDWRGPAAPIIGPTTTSVTGSTKAVARSFLPRASERRERVVRWRSASMKTLIAEVLRYECDVIAFEDLVGIVTA